MKDRERIDYARREVEDIRRALLDAAAFGKTLTPLSLERMADRLTAAIVFALCLCPMPATTAVCGIDLG